MASPGVVPSADVLSVLRGFDPDVEEILASSGHVSLYTMAVESQQWTRKDVEGSLFLLKRRGTPRFRMMVLNKLSTENYIEDIHGGLDFELNPPYLMYTHGNSEIIGVWFYEQEDLHRIENVLMRIKQASQQMAKPAAAARAQPGATRLTGGKADDDNFYDKPNASAAPPHTQPPALPHQSQPQLHGATTAGTMEGNSNLATLLRNATLKQQQQQQAVEPATLPTAASALPPQPLPPSFFSQQHRPAPAQPAAVPPQQPPPFTLTAVAPQPAIAVVAAPQAAAGPQGQVRVPQVPVPLQAPPDQPTPGSQVMGGALAKLFANAHKAAPAHPPAQPQAAGPPAAQVASQPPPPPPPTAPAVPHPAAGGPPVSSGGGGLSDEERVRRLLARIATNEALVKLLAVELRAVGLL